MGGGRFSRWLWVAASLAALGLVAPAGCGDGSVPSPFEDPDASADAAADSGADADVIDPTLGPPCLDDAQCDDELECTFDACDHGVGRCRYTPDDSKCFDTVYCDGAEVCDPKLGCREGQPISCDDDKTCTIDTCVESSKSCVSEPRDADGDGDPDWSCGGGDCNDTTAAISSKQPEVCGNGQDDDCDLQKDEADCKSAKHDTCADALEINGPGNYVMSLAAAKGDYAASCAGGGSWVDVVAALQVPAGGPKDVDVLALSDMASVALSAFGKCGDVASELACDAGHTYKKGGQMSRVRLRSLAPGYYPLFVHGMGAGDVALKVQHLAPTTAPVNETCGTALPLAPGVATKVALVDAKQDIVSDCENSSALGELVYRIELTEPKDVHVWATSLDGYGAPVLSLLEAPCSGASDELTCNSATAAHVFGRALPAGTHYVAVSASAPSELEVLLELQPPSQAPADESCASSPNLTPGLTEKVPLAGHADDLKLGCMSGAVDAAWALPLGAPSDVLLVARSSDNDSVAVALAKPPCAATSDVVSCDTATISPVRTSAHALPTGSYRAVVESQNGAPMTLTAFVRPAKAPTLVAFADTCATAVKIPESGGFFLGNTANVNADYAAGCDLGSQGPAGAPEQMLKLDLSAKKRVILDMRGSTYSTLLAVRKADGCPGAEISKACAAGYGLDKSFLDVTLEAGSYFVQVDGYAGQYGQWFLEVFVSNP